MVLCLTGTGIILLGLIMAGPKVYKLTKCRNTIDGKIVNIYTASGFDNRTAKITFTYTVGQKQYTNNTGWTNYGVYQINGKIRIKYDEKNPQRSYIPNTGLFIKSAVGFLFLVTGLVIVIIGTIVKL